MQNGNQLHDIPSPLLKKKEEIRKKRFAILPPDREFPVHVFPEPVRNLIYGYQEANNFNPEFQAGALLAVFAAIAGNNYRLRLKQGWTEPCILWVPIIGHAASLKTPVLKTYLRPLWSMEKTWKEEYDLEVKLYKKAQEDKTIEPDAPGPKRRELVMSSATMESIFKVHEANQNGLLLFRDELLGWVKSMDQYRKGAGDDQENWLSMYNNEPLKISRASKETQFVEKASVSVLGGMQPAVLGDLAASARQGNGFTYRLSFVYPGEVTTPRWTEKEVDVDLIHKYENSVFQLIKHPPATMGEPMVFTPEARRKWTEWYNMNQEYTDLTDDDMRKSIYSKLISQCARLAIVMQVMKFGYGLADANMVDMESITAATEIVEYFRHTSIKAHNKFLEADSKVEMAADMYVHDNMSIREIANRLGVGKTTVSRWKNQSPKMFDKSRVNY